MNRRPNARGDILVVDDNPANLRLLTDMLGQENFVVRVAADGTQALKSIAARLPDLILLDISMPGMNGFELCTHIKQNEQWRQVPILFLSALNDTEDKKRAFAAGGVDYITKPFQAEEVLMRVNTHIELSRSRLELQRAYQEMEQRAERKSRELVAAREEQFRITELLKSSFERTINAIALALEKRDPYTAGHQKKVAEITTAVAQRLGFSPHEVEGLRLGAMIHDIGKIYVPVEILSRPGRISKAEFNVIKSHPEVGYDIIKGIDFPWPVGEMVLQHHERLDGSGYPFGLSGEEIDFNAKIIAVADVTEAMSSHRPYRPALGIDAAIAEIDNNKGKRYDVDVVQAVLDIHKEGALLPLISGTT